MFDVSSIMAAKKKAENNYEKNADNFDQEYNAALGFLKEFTETEDTVKIKKAADKFFSAIKCKRSRVEPYIYITYIYYLFNEDELAKKYLGYAKSLEPGRSEILDLQRLLNTK